MGRIKTALIKRITNQLVTRYGTQLKTDFEQNKVLVSKLVDVSSQKMRNTIAGYATRLTKKNQQLK